MAFIFIAYNQTSINYHWEGPMRRLVTATLLAYISFGASYYYCLTNEEYKANRLKSRIAIGAVFTFFFASDNESS